MYVGGIIVLDGNSRPIAETADGEKQSINAVGKIFSFVVRFILPPDNAEYLTPGRKTQKVAVLPNYTSNVFAFKTRAVDWFRDGKNFMRVHQI